MEPLVLYIYDKPNGYQGLLEQQLKRAKVDYIADEIPAFTWVNRIIRTIHLAEQYPDRVLFFVDAWDTLFLGHKWELENPVWEEGITFASQKKCWPDQVDMLWNKFWEYKVSTRWRYLNSNPMAGLGKNIARAILWGWEKFPLAGQTNDVCDVEGNVCERFYTNLAFRAPKEWDIKIDTECRLGQTVAEGGTGELAVHSSRVVNLITNTQPLFFHLNGKMVFDVRLLDA